MFLEPIFDFFPNLNTLMFSTNASIPFEKGIKIFIDFLYQYTKTHNRNLTFDLQFSIDGPAYLTDVSRNRENITEVICNTIYRTAEYANEYCNDLFKLRMVTKPTVDASYWPHLLAENNLFEWFKFFNDLSLETKKLIKNNCIECYLAQEPTLVSPAAFTKQDGINYAKLIKRIRKLDTTVLTEYEHPILKRYLNAWYEAIGDSIFNPYSLTCGAGIGSSAIDYEGTLMTCHRFYDDYKMSGEYNEAGLNISVAANKKELARINYVNAAYHSSYRFKQSMVDAYVVALVSAGEIDKKYLNPNYRQLIFTFLGGNSCPIGECGSMTHSLHLIPISNIRLLCNGALEELFNYYDTTL